ncbi:glycogen operon protein [Sphingomonas gellani]|uniref:Glycogen operon protein n=1 Tax=Sphingomonas gellani TaxID=1166340 RepID=A0A1H8DRF5_9SPHN|nr:glycogen debranching protein GlgX [Sphingomonas gellani]SEN09148.1 glycogen operon protein [Sphingomonas gellani]
MTAQLGAHPYGGGTRFAVRSRPASAAWLCLFDGDRETRIAMERNGDIWSVEVPGRGIGTGYGYRVEGPGLDPAKLLVDPYAVVLDRRFAHDPRLAAAGLDTAALVPKAVVQAPLVAAPPPPLFQPGGLIYEINVPGFSMLHPDVPELQRGTLAALAHPAVIAHLQRIGVAAVELMPIVAWIDERHLAPLGLRNAWGYNPVVPMALDPGLVPGGLAELTETVAALRAAGIGTILDLVFNHTGESDVEGPTLSLRGLDPDLYYTHSPDGALVNDAGTGNVLDASRVEVRDLILASLRHFARAGVDGFRFDLATILARGPGFDADAPIFAEIAADPILSDRVMIAEPWDVGPGGYQLGRFPEGWLEWNDRYRDDVRRFWRGDGDAGTLATRLSGSSDLFGGPATRTVNFVAAHDGFTLADTVAYAAKHNIANGEDNRDGTDHNASWNNGVEGASDDAAVLGLRATDRRALLATLFASRGTIMLTAGDEFGRSQGGNNNAYAQDNAIGWIDWNTRDRDLEAFVAELAARRAGGAMEGDAWLGEDAVWLDVDGRPMTPASWAGAEGFELRLPGACTIRVDRRAREVTLTRD